MNPVKTGLGITAVVLAVGLGLSLKGKAGDKLDQIRDKQVWDKYGHPDTSGSATSIVNDLNRAMRGFGTDEDKIVDVLSSIQTREKWNQVKELYQKLGTSITAEFDGELDQEELEVVRAITTAYNSRGSNELKVRHLNGWAHRIHWWIGRGSVWWGVGVDDPYWVRVEQVFNEVPGVSIFPYLARAFRAIFNESLIQFLLNSLEDSQWQTLSQIIQTKPDANGQNIRHLLSRES